jgi:hypothetical protein
VPEPSFRCHPSSSQPCERCGSDLAVGPRVKRFEWPLHGVLIPERRLLHLDHHALTGVPQEYLFQLPQASGRNPKLSKKTALSLSANIFQDFRAACTRAERH